MTGRPFFSCAGRASPASFVGWVALGLGMLAVCLFALAPGGYPVLIGAFAVAGAVVAKLRAETVRRLRDEDAANGTGWAIAVVVVAGPSYLVIRYLVQGADAVTVGILGVLLVMWALTLLRPGRPGRVADPTPKGTGLIAAAAFIVTGGLLGWWVAHTLDAMSEAHRRNAARAPGAVVPARPADRDDAVLDKEIDALRRQEAKR